MSNYRRTLLRERERIAAAGGAKTPGGIIIPGPGAGRVNGHPPQPTAIPLHVLLAKAADMLLELPDLAAIHADVLASIAAGSDLPNEHERRTVAMLGAFAKAQAELRATFPAEPVGSPGTGDGEVGTQASSDASGLIPDSHAPTGEAADDDGIVP